MSSRNLVDLAQALADPLRLTILERLMDGPTAVSELVLLTRQAQSKVSNHLAVLRDRGLVNATRVGRHQRNSPRPSRGGRPGT